MVRLAPNDTQSQAEATGTPTASPNKSKQNDPQPCPVGGGEGFGMWSGEMSFHASLGVVIPLARVRAVGGGW